MAKKSDEFNIESGLTQLKEIVSKMEQQQLSLDDALAQFEQGVALIRNCQKALDSAEQKVSILLKKNDQVELTPFEQNNDE